MDSDDSTRPETQQELLDRMIAEFRAAKRRQQMKLAAALHNGAILSDLLPDAAAEKLH
jgi:hypothetical protein